MKNSDLVMQPVEVGRLRPDHQFTDFIFMFFCSQVDHMCVCVCVFGSTALVRLVALQVFGNT